MTSPNHMDDAWFVRRFIRLWDEIAEAATPDFRVRLESELGNLIEEYLFGGSQDDCTNQEKTN
jgi:hypothetical protein